MAKAVERVKRQPDDPSALLTLSRVTAESAQTLETVDLDRGIAAARRARRLEPKLYEALYWEAACHELAGRTQKAMTLYEDFVESAHLGPHHPMIKTARRRIAQAPADDSDDSSS